MSSFLYFLTQLTLFFSSPWIQKLFTTHHIFTPTIWSFYSNHESFNIAVPDSYATYYQSFVYLNDGESLVIKSYLQDYKYFSLQIYDSRAVTLGNINYLQSVDGNFNIEITKELKRTNATNTMLIKSNSSVFIVVFRTYDFSDIPSDISEYPNITIENTRLGMLKTSDKYVNLKYNWIWPDLNPVKQQQYTNLNNNFVKPELNSYFYNDDASYLISNIKNPSSNMGMIVRGELPTEDQVLYTSFNLGTSSLPLHTIAGDHYNSNKKLISSTGRAGLRHIEIIKRYGDTEKWNLEGRKYIIYIGLNLDHIRNLGGDPDVDLYLLYPIQYFTGKPYTNLILVHRHLMPHSKLNQFKQSSLLTTFNQSIANINKIFAHPYECEQVMLNYYPKIEFVFNN
jgi:hypothetical protein